MTLEKMNEEIDRLENSISESKRKRDELVEQRDREIMKQMQRIFAKHHLSMNELIKLKNASTEELKAMFKVQKEEGDSHE